MNIVYLLFVFIYEMISQKRPQEEREERLRKIKFIMFTGPRDRHGIQGHMEKHQGGQEAEKGSA